LLYDVQYLLTDLLCMNTDGEADVWFPAAEGRVRSWCV